MNGIAYVARAVVTPDDAGRARPAGAAMDEGALVRRAAAGDRAAFGVLYERYLRAVHGILLAHAAAGRHGTDVDDLVHDVFLAALERLGTLRDPSAFGAWLAAIARNRARMARRNLPTVLTLPDDVAAPAAAEPDAGLVLAAIRSLPAAYREPLVLRLVEGLSGAEIAARTGLTPASVRVNLHRGMTQLRQKLGGANA